jgi:death-on-curing protein
MEPKWLTARLVQAIHSQAVADFGGSHGVRDMGLLESALDRPRNLYAYGDDPTLFDLAAAYCAGIVKNHPFIDGNKRTGDLAARAFLFRNGYLFEPDEADEVNMIVALAAGEIEEDVLARWISENSTPKRA